MRFAWGVALFCVLAIVGCGGGSSSETTRSEAPEVGATTGTPRTERSGEAAPAKQLAPKPEPEPEPKPAPKSKSQPAPNSATRTVAEKLATIEANAPPDESLIEEFDEALARLEPVCRNQPIKLSDDTVVAHELLAEAGIDESYLSILQHVRQAIPSDTPASDCTQIFASYVTLRKGG